MAADPERSFFLYGDYASWKTYLAAAQFNWFLDRYLPGDVKFFTDWDLYQSLRRAEMGEAMPAITVADIAAMKIKHITIDDLGKKRVSEFIRSAYFALFDSAYKNGCGVTVTSNHHLDELVENAAGEPIYDAGMIRRLDHTCDVLHLQR